MAKTVHLFVNVPPSSSIRTTEERGNARMLVYNKKTNFHYKSLVNGRLR